MAADVTFGSMAMGRNQNLRFNPMQSNPQVPTLSRETQLTCRANHRQDTIFAKSEPKPRWGPGAMTRKRNRAETARSSACLPVASGIFDARRAGAIRQQW